MKKTAIKSKPKPTRTAAEPRGVVVHRPCSAFTVREVPAVVDIMFEIETTLQGGERAIYQTPRSYNGGIVRMNDAQKRDSIRKAWRSLSKSKGDKLIAFHVPVAQWRRIAMKPNVAAEATASKPPPNT